MQPYHGYGAGYGGPVPQSDPPQRASRRPQWWIAAAVAVGFGALEAPFALLSLIAAPILTTAGLLLLAVIVTVCFVTGRRAPNADAVGLGFVLALLLNLAIYVGIAGYAFFTSTTAGA